MAANSNACQWPLTLDLTMDSADYRMPFIFQKLFMIVTPGLYAYIVGVSASASAYLQNAAINAILDDKPIMVWFLPLLQKQTLYCSTTKCYTTVVQRKWDNVCLVSSPRQTSELEKQKHYDVSPSLTDESVDIYWTIHITDFDVYRAHWSYRVASICRAVTRCSDYMSTLNSSF